MLGWFTRLPKLLQGLGVVTAYALSTFSGRLDEGWQDLGLWLGFILGTLFLIGLCLHAVKDWRGSEKVGPTDLIMVGLGGLALFAVVALAGFVWQSYAPSSRDTPTPPKVASKEINQPTVELLAPEARHEIFWNPEKDPEIVIASEGKIDPGKWTTPHFHLRATGGVPIQDATVEWSADVVGLTNILESSARLDKYDFRIEEGKITIPSKANGGLPFGYEPQKTGSYSLQFITPNPPGTLAFIPVDVFAYAMLYTVALLPDGLGEELGPIPFSLVVSWTFPAVGKQEFSVNAFVKNVKPANVSEPLVNGLVKFDVKQVN